MYGVLKKHIESQNRSRPGPSDLNKKKKNDSKLMCV